MNNECDAFDKWMIQAIGYLSKARTRLNSADTKEAHYTVRNMLEKAVAMIMKMDCCASAHSAKYPARHNVKKD